MLKTKYDKHYKSLKEQTLIRQFGATIHFKTGTEMSLITSINKTPLP